MNACMLSVFLALLGMCCFSLDCQTFPRSDTNAPCIEVPRCGNYANITVNKLSTGLGLASSFSNISICFDEHSFHLFIHSYNQNIITETDFNQCNDYVYNSNSIAVYFAPNMEEINHCYNELYLSPFNNVYNAGVFSPSLTSTSDILSPFQCNNSGIDYKASIEPSLNEWTSFISIPFPIMDCPYNCPLQRYCGKNGTNNVYRANFFRINELESIDVCTNASCEYIAWNPTSTNPPDFNVPSSFGYLLLQNALETIVPTSPPTLSPSTVVVPNNNDNDNSSIQFSVLMYCLFALGVVMVAICLTCAVRFFKRKRDASGISSAISSIQDLLLSNSGSLNSVPLSRSDEEP